MPLHMHPYYRDTHGYHPDDLPVAKAAFERMISLPIYPKHSDDDLRYVAETVQAIAAETRR
jgi:perosamine synthetase